MGVESEEREVDKSEKATVVEIRKLMFVKPEKRMASRQRCDWVGWLMGRSEAAPQETGYKCEKRGCKSGGLLRWSVT